MHGMKKKKLNGILHMNSLSVIWLLYGVLCVWVTTVYSTSSLITVLHEALQNILNSTDINHGVYSLSLYNLVSSRYKQVPVVVVKN